MPGHVPPDILASLPEWGREAVLYIAETRPKYIVRPASREGGTNHVFALSRPARPPRYVLKIPPSLRRERVIGNLRYEYMLLQTLTDSPIKMPVKIPRPKEYDIDYCHYMLATHVPGAVFTRAEALQTLSEDNLCALALTLAEFIFRLSQAVTPKVFEEVTEGRTALKFWRRDQLEHHFQLAPVEFKLDAPNLRRVILWAIENAYDFHARSGDDLFLGHNDLGSKNWALRQKKGDWQLDGIFDFGNAQPSSPPQEMRFLYGYSPAAGKLCAQHYERISGQIVNRESLRLWASAEFSLRMYDILTKGTFSVGLFEEAKSGLMLVHPEYDWSELDRIWAGIRQSA